MIDDDGDEDDDDDDDADDDTYLLNTPHHLYRLSPLFFIGDDGDAVQCNNMHQFITKIISHSIVFHQPPHQPHGSTHHAICTAHPSQPTADTSSPVALSALVAIAAFFSHL